MSSGVSAANLSTLRLMWLLLSCTHSALRHTKSSGDLNGDGQIRVVDAVIALQMAVRGERDDNADMDGDGRVSSVDALMILQVAVGT